MIVKDILTRVKFIYKIKQIIDYEIISLYYLLYCT